MPKRPKREDQTSYQSVKALLVGINYRGTSNELGGCINDVLNTKRRILSEYPTAKIELLTDDTPVQPTRNNILEKLKDLVSSSMSGDILMFHYSGHGSQVPDLHGDEEDGKEETICPIDYATPRTIMFNGRTKRVDSQIIDDEIHEIISNIPKDVKLLMLSDSCHSGTIGDLKYDFAHYQGPSEWSDDSMLQPSQSSSTLSNTLLICNARWSLAKFSKEIWLTPLNLEINQKVGNLKIALTDGIPEALLVNNSMLCKTTFKQVDNNRYEVVAPAISDLIFIAEPLNLAPAKKQITRSLLDQQLINTRSNAVYNYNYDHNSGKHVHYFDTVKRSLVMKSPTCSGGELRIISGCEENQTSADTGKNGACTKAFWDTVLSLGGFGKFLPKVFSHHVEDLKLIQDTINANLSKLGFTQHSVISWEHAHKISTPTSSPARDVVVYDSPYRSRLRTYRPTL
jgi:hypothetical protein